METGLGGEKDDFKIKGAASGRRDDGHMDVCTICQQTITERAVAVPCNHLTFDFICLATWLQEQTRCPLCNAEVTAVEYDWRAPDDYKTYHVKSASGNRHHSGGLRSSIQNSSADVPATVRGERHAAPAGSRIRGAYKEVPAQDPALERRRNVYRNRLYSLHVGANSVSGYRDFGPQQTTHSAEMQSRARAFLRRELRVFSFLDPGFVPRGRSRDSVMEHVVAIAKAFDLKGADGRAEDLIAEYIGRENARLLLHELEAWLRSPYPRLEDWDSNVQYATDGIRNASEATIT